jgi:hypothetical protein
MLAIAQKWLDEHNEYPLEACWGQIPVSQLDIGVANLGKAGRKLQSYAASLHNPPFAQAKPSLPLQQDILFDFYYACQCEINSNAVTIEMGSSSFRD